MIFKLDTQEMISEPQTGIDQKVAGSIPVWGSEIIS